MKKILIMLLIFPMICTAQLRELVHNGKVLTFQGQVLTDYARLISSINYDNLEMTTTTLFDNTNYGNNWTLKNSNGLKLNDVAYVVYNSPVDTIYIPFNRDYTFTFYASLENNANGAIIGGYRSSNDNVLISNTGMQVRTILAALTFTNITTPTDSIIRKYQVVIDTDSVEVTNVTDNVSQKLLNTIGNDSIGFKFIGRKGNGTNRLTGYVFGLNFNDEAIFPLAEGKRDYVYNVIEGDSARIQSHIDTIWQKQDLYHYNLVHGFSLYQSVSLVDIFIPYYYNGDTIVTTVPGYNLIETHAGGLFHNSAETGVEPPLSLLPYDYNNYLFDVSNNPNVIYYDNMSENVGNRIFINVSTPYQYKDIRVYNREVN